MSRIVFFILILFSGCAFAQTQTNTFFRKYNLSGMQGSLGVVNLSDGGFVGTGQHEDNGSAGSCDVYVYRIDACGNLLWMKLIGSAGMEGGKSIQQKQNGNLIITGLYDSKGMLFELDLNGNLLWEKRYDNTAWTHAVDECANGDLLVTGSTVSGEFVLMRCDNIGNVIWAKTIMGKGDLPLTVIALSNGDIFINSTYNIPGKDFAAMLFDSIGNVKWSKSYGGVGYTETDYQSWGSKAIYDSTDNSIMVIGQTLINGNDDIILAKLSITDGGVIWAKLIGDTASDQARDIVLTDNGYAILGNSMSYPALASSNPGVLTEDLNERDILLVNLDTLGNFLWAKTYGGIERDKGIGLRYNYDKTFLIDAYSSSPVFGNFDNSMDPLFIKTDPQGVVGCQYFSPVVSVVPVVLSIDSVFIETAANISVIPSQSVVSDYFPADSFQCLQCSTVPLIQPSDTVVCINESVNFYNITVIGLVCFQKWNVNGILYNGNEDTITYTFSTPGLYPVKLYSDCGASTDTFTVYIRVYPEPVSSFSATEVCVNNPTVFTNSTNIQSGTVSSWLWDFGDNSTSNSVNPSHQYQTPGNYSVQLSAVSDMGCINTATNPVNVFPLPFASFVSDNVCAEDTFQAVNNSTSAYTLTGFSWAFGDGSVSSQQHVSHSYSEPGQYNVNLHITDSNGCADDYSKQVEVYPLPVADMELPSLCELFPSAEFKNKSLNSVSWEWDFGDQFTSSQYSPIHTYESEGSYVITLTVLSDKGCKDAVSKTAEFKGYFNIWIPNAFTPNNDENNDRFFPVAEGISEFKMEIYDRWGLLIFETNDMDKGWDSTINGRKAQEDVYVYRINVKDFCEKHHSYIGHFSLLH